MPEFGEYWRCCRERTERVLEKVFEERTDISPRLLEAMRYATLGGGKRLRAMLVYAGGEKASGHLSACRDMLDKAAAAVEMVHAYSLVHDDLPAMDDDDLRRGKPTCHRKFDEATAVLAGDALQSLSFELLSEGTGNGLSAERRLRMVKGLADGIGARGMAGGQQYDMDATGDQVGIEQLKQIHSLKTGALIRTSCVLGGLAVEGIGETHVRALEQFGTAIGMSFQIMDDILDVTADSETLGKDSESDERMNKTTFVSLLGLDGALSARDEWHEKAVHAAFSLEGNDGIFRKIADFVVTRNY